MNHKRLLKAGNILLFFTLVVVFIVLSSCVSKKKFEEATAQVQSLQTKISDLEKTVTDKDAEINKLKAEIESIKAKLPEEYEVQAGDSHWKIGFDFLLKKGVSEEVARKLLQEAALFDPLQVGFKVFNYFSGDIFGSFITKGSASISPGGLLRFLRRQAEDEKQNLKNEIAALKGKIEELNNQLVEAKKEKEAAVNELNSRIDSLNREIKNFQAQTADMDSRLNSVYYFIGPRDDLKAKGKIKGTFLGICGTRVADVAFTDFNKKIDLRQNDSIEIQASDLGIRAIKEIELLPGDLEKDRDYKVAISGNGASAKVTLSNKEKFLLARIIVVVN